MGKTYQQWINDNQDQAWSLARYLLQDRAEAEDVLQEVFIKLWQHRESLPLSKVKPWILRVTRNHCLDRLRKRRPESEIEEHHMSHEEGPEQQLQRADTGKLLQASIANLEEPYRSLVILRDLQQHSYQEIATVTELSLPQVKTYLHRARKQLREQLTKGWQ